MINNKPRSVGKNYAGYGEIQKRKLAYVGKLCRRYSTQANPVAGQIWFDSATAKLKFYDGTKFRTTGGAEVSTSTPTGLTTGDFCDTANSQLYAWDGTSFVLVGPKVQVPVTQFTTRQIKDTLNAQQLIIEGKVNNTTVVLFSATEFTIDATQTNTITGFDVVKKGLTLVNTQSGNKCVIQQLITDIGGQHPNSDRLGGSPASDYLRSVIKLQVLLDLQMQV